MSILSVLAAVAIIGILWAFMAATQSKLDDPTDHTVVHLDELESLVALEPTGTFVLNLYRQSGNIYADGRVFETREAALAAGFSTFRRAKIDAVVIRTNTANNLDVSRAFFNHRGRAEGKKVGSLEVIRVT